MQENKQTAGAQSFAGAAAAGSIREGGLLLALLLMFVLLSWTKSLPEKQLAAMGRGIWGVPLGSWKAFVNLSFTCLSYCRMGLPWSTPQKG